MASGSPVKTEGLSNYYGQDQCHLFDDKYGLKPNKKDATLGYAFTIF